MGRRDKKGANQHNARHENGVVAPYKKATRQRSNGHLNGSADGKAKEGAPSVPSIPSQNLTVPSEAVATAAPNNASASNPRSLSGSRQHQHGKNLTVNVSDDLEDLDVEDAAKMGELQYRKIDVNSAKQSTAPESGPFNLALTVLRSCPIGDTLAILIFLLSLPPTFLNLTNAMFAMLTFVPPSGSFTTLPSLTDITSSFSPATPSFIVLVLIDFLAISLWYMIPFPQLQGMLLDCAQATVATTLGGGYSSRPGASDNLLLMVTVVFATHLGRYRKTTLRWLHRTYLTKWLPMVDSFDDMPPRPSYELSTNRTWLDTIKIWVAIHILFQGLTRMVRRSLHSSRGTSIFSSHSRSIDPEAIANASGAAEALEGSHNPPSSPSILKSKSSLQNLRDVRDKISSGKRRRKQANYVRSQQPLWAAFAATKATIMREYEQSQATRDASGSNAEGAKNLGCAPFADEEDRVWITAIDLDKFYFATGPLTPSKCRGSCRKKDKLDDEAGIDQTKPFFVRINGANWASVKIEELEETENSEGGLQWVGEVYGLSPASTYRVAFTKRGDGVELHSEVIVTPSPPVAEQVSPSNPAPPQALRPASPASPVATLKTSIAAFESSVNDTIGHQKRMRKDTRANVTALRRELEVLTEKLARLANSDKGLTGRQSQLNANIQQAEDATSTLSEEIETFTEIPEEALSDWREQKVGWEQTRNEQSRVQEDLQRTKEENRKNYNAAQTDALTARQKKETLQARTTKLTDRHKRLTSSEVAPDSRQSQSDHSQRSKERERTEGHYQEQINALRRSFQDASNRWLAINTQRTAMVRAADQHERARQAQHSRLQYGSRPITPEGDIPGTKSNAPVSDAYGYGRYAAFNTPDSQPVLPAGGFGSAGTNGPVRRVSNRRRSQSGVSGSSLYLESYEDDDEDPIPVQHKRKSGIGSVREGSDGKSSGSGSPHVPYVPQLGHRGKSSPAGGSSG